MGEVPRISVNGLTACSFLDDFAAPKRPVIILDVVKDWVSLGLEQMGKDFEGCQGPVTDCNAEAEPTTWDIGKYCEWAREGGDGQLLYLKDWHMVHDCRRKNLEVPYRAPDFLCSPLHDWLNLHMDLTSPNEGGYRFCYVGVKGTGTKLHHDVLYSHSWSANVCGRKQWILYPPELRSLLERHPDLSPKVHVELKEAWEQRLEVIQEAGELLFVPSGWYHEVENLSLAISINHNWLNASNGQEVWQFLQREWLAVKAKLERESFTTEEEFLTQCLVVMKANSGLDMGGWLTLLCAACDELHRCLEEDLTEERRRELDWVASKLGALCTECVQTTELWSLPSLAEKLDRLHELQPRSPQELQEMAAKMMVRLREQWSQLLAEHRQVRADQQAEREELEAQHARYSERRKALRRRCANLQLQ